MSGEAGCRLGMLPACAEEWSRAVCTAPWTLHRNLGLACLIPDSGQAHTAPPLPSSNSGFGVLTSAYDRSQRYLPSLTAAQEALDGLLAPGQCSALVQVSCA